MNYATYLSATARRKVGIGRKVAATFRFPIPARPTGGRRAEIVNDMVFWVDVLIILQIL